MFQKVLNSKKGIDEIMSVNEYPFTSFDTLYPNQQLKRSGNDPKVIPTLLSYSLLITPQPAQHPSKGSCAVDRMR